MAAARLVPQSVWQHIDDIFLQCWDNALYSEVVRVFRREIFEIERNTQFDAPCGTQGSGLLLSAAYFVWLGILVERSFRHIGGMSPEYIFVMAITLVTIFGTMAAVFTGALAPDQVRLINLVSIRYLAKKSKLG